MELRSAKRKAAPCPEGIGAIYSVIESRRVAVDGPADSELAGVPDKTKVPLKRKIGRHPKCLPYNFVKIPFHLRPASRPTSAIRAENSNPPCLVENDISDWPVHLLGEFMSSICAHSLDADDQEMIAAVFKYAEWARTRFDV